MAGTRPEKVYDLGGSGRLMVTRQLGRKVRQDLTSALEELPRGGVLYVDTRNVEMMDYSFADEALGVLVSRVAGGEFKDRYLVLVESDRDLLENIDASLKQRSLAMLRIDELGGERILVGDVPDHLLETLDVIEAAGSITNADLAAKLRLNHTACNNRAARLAKLGLIHRRVETAAPGGRQYVYERIA